MSLQGVEKFCFDFHSQKSVELEFSAARLSSDGGLLAVREFDRKIGLTKKFAAALNDARGGSPGHSLSSMVRQRIFGILAGYEDQNDHDTLRTDPVFQIICDRTPGEARDELASQPTLSRFENSVSIADLWRLRDAICDQFLESFATPPKTITLDIDAFDDTTHGQQQLTFFHGHYDQHQYFPIAITCAENDMVTLIGLRHGTASAFLGVDDDLRYLTKRMRTVWPEVNIVVRGDAGYGVPTMYDVCEELKLTYTFGICVNPVLKKRSENLQAQAVTQYDATGEKQRLFMEFEYQAKGWPTSRRVVIKCEAGPEGINRRAVVTNRIDFADDSQRIYDDYIERGESENRNKELKVELCADRLSDHRFMANFFRLYLHAAALNLLIRLRQVTAKESPVPETDPTSTEPKPTLSEPEQTKSKATKKREANERRRNNPLGEGFACTWRTMFIKVACEVTVSVRRIVVNLSSHWPHFEEFTRVSHRINTLPHPTG